MGQHLVILRAIRDLLAYIAAELFAQQLLDEIQSRLKVYVVMIHCE
jgi:hypothetical protein